MNVSELQTHAAAPDPSWNRMYRTGGISALLYVLLSLAVPTVMVFATSYDFSMEGGPLLRYLADHHTFWLILQTLVLGTSILAIVTFTALYLALRHLEKSYAALGAVLTVTCQILFLAYYPVLLGLVNLGEQYDAAAPGRREALATAADALMAVNNAFNPLYEAVFALGILFFSLAMLKGVFHRGVAWLGISNAPAAFIALALWPLIGIGYFWWWLFFVAWFVAVGWKLYQLGRPVR